MNYLVVAAAGFMGAITRKFIGGLFMQESLSAIPFNTLFVNITGCLLLGFFMTVTAERFKINPQLRLGVGTGFLGAYTTFSTFTVETINLMHSGQIVYALTYLFVTPALCIFFAWAGVSAGKSMFRVVGEAKVNDEKG